LAFHAAATARSNAITLKNKPGGNVLGQFNKEAMFGHESGSTALNAPEL